MKPVLIIQTGRAPDPIRARHGDFPHWLRLSAGLRSSQIQVIDVVAGESLPPAQAVAGAIITGSGAMVTERADWSERTAEWVRLAVDASLPLFGVCYGHQLMAHALGGQVDYLPGGREIGTQTIEVSITDPDPWMGVLPASFRAHTTHEQSVITAPKDAIVLARSARDPHQILRYGTSALSTQFHPEFNAEVMRAYIKRKHTDMQREGLDPHQTFRAVGATPVARRLLRQFSRHHRWIASR